MKFFTILPPPHLAPFVRYFWVLESTAAVPIPYIYRSLADGCAELIFHYKGTFEEMEDTHLLSQAYSMMHGPSQRFRRFITHEHFGIFGAYLYPYAISQFFPVTAAAIADEMPDLSTLLGQSGQDLEERMILAQDHQERSQILSAFLERQLSKNRSSQVATFAAINKIIKSPGKIDIEAIAQTCCLSRRQFERHFKTHAGFSPKRYARIIRFQAALQDYGNVNKSLTDIAYDCGYYDQSHFIHDFKSFSGYHPSRYFSGLAEGVEYREVL